MSKTNKDGLDKIQQDLLESKYKEWGISSVDEVMSRKLGNIKVKRDVVSKFVLEGLEKALDDLVMLDGENIKQSRIRLEESIYWLKKGIG